MGGMAIVYAGFTLLMGIYARWCWLRVGSTDIPRDAMARHGLQFAVPAFLMSAGATIYLACRLVQG
jgi:hypothetical protein